MKLLKRTIVAFAALMLLAFLLLPFIKGEVDDTSDAVNFDELTGQRVGVVCAYEADYLLTGRDDLTLLRYDNQSDCLVALAYKKVDAIAVPLDAADYVLEVSTGLKINDEPIALTGNILCFREDTPYWSEFNDFIEEFQKTDKYKEYCQRIQDGGFKDGSEILEETGTGKVIKMGYVVDLVPIIYKDTKTGKPSGYEAEILREFANYMDYQIEWVGATEEVAYQQALSGQIDGYALGYTDVYRFEYELNQKLEMTDKYRDTSIVLVEIEDYENLSLGVH